MAGHNLHDHGLENRGYQPKSKRFWPSCQNLLDYGKMAIIYEILADLPQSLYGFLAVILIIMADLAIIL